MESTSSITTSDNVPNAFCSAATCPFKYSNVACDSYSRVSCSCASLCPEAEEGEEEAEEEGKEEEEEEEAEEREEEEGEERHRM